MAANDETTERSRSPLAMRLDMRCLLERGSARCRAQLVAAPAGGTRGPWYWLGGGGSVRGWSQRGVPLEPADAGAAVLRRHAAHRAREVRDAAVGGDEAQ